MELDADAVYVKYADDLVRLAAVVAGPSQAEDVVASVMVRVLLDGDGRWRSIENLWGYLVRAVMNESRSRQRSARRRLRRELLSVNDTRRDGGDEFGVVRVEVLDALGRLSVRQRAVVYFTYWLAYRAEDVAGELGCSVRTVERELSSARRELEVLLR